ncbi:MAG: type II toxin-antitoxin system VapC family toxin [Promethearchaeota archaeon]
MNYIFDTNALIKLSKINYNFTFGNDATSILSVIEFPYIVKKAPNLEVLYPTRKDFDTSYEMILALRNEGYPIPAMDAIIGGIALNAERCLVTSDNHFEYIKEYFNRDFNFISCKEFCLFKGIT